MAFGRVALGAALGLGSATAHGTTYENFPITYEALPEGVRAPIAVDITTDQFKARLKDGGTVTLVGNVTTIAEVDLAKKTLAFMALDVLELRKSAKIITNGNSLVIFANKIISEDGAITSFLPAMRKAAAGKPIAGDGKPGGPGDAGLSGGVVSLQVIDGIEGILHVDLTGQDGGDGALGQTGGPGASGSPGQDAQDDIVVGGFGLGLGSCKRSGGDGTDGGQGLPGGPGGVGGAGGDGGFLQIVNIGPQAIPAAAYTFTGAGGKPGANAPGSDGGPGGPGGPFGHGSIYCSGGKNGPTGPKGSPGAQIATVSRTGQDGQALIKNLSLDVMVHTAVNPTVVLSSARSSRSPSATNP